MNIKRILCPIDFSEFNRDANEFASALADSWQASIVYLTVPEQDAGDDYEAAMQRVAERELKQLKEYTPTRSGVECTHDVKVSSRTAQTIIDYARDNDIDLIVMATQGRSGIRRIIMGSVAEAVVRNASCPVLTLKPDNKHFAEAVEGSKTTSTENGS